MSVVSHFMLLGPASALVVFLLRSLGSLHSWIHGLAPTAASSRSRVPVTKILVHYRLPLQQSSSCFLHLLAMKIRRARGSRACLPPSPTHRSSLQVQKDVPQHVGAVDGAKDGVNQEQLGAGAIDDTTDTVNQAALSLLTLASTRAPVPKNSIAGPRELGEVSSLKRKRKKKLCLEHEPVKNRASADFNYHSSFRSPGESEFPPEKSTPSSKKPRAEHGVEPGAPNSLGPGSTRSVLCGNRQTTIRSKDHGKWWKCCQFSHDSGFAMSKCHRDPINSNVERPKRRKSKLAEPDSPFMYVANTRVVTDCDDFERVWSPFKDEELAHDENRQFVKAKSIQSIMWNT